jgi:hypothetical protein
MVQIVAGNGVGRPSAESHATVSRLAHVDETDVCLQTYVTASELERHLVRAITSRTNGRVQGIRVQMRGGRIVLSGFSESYYAVQLALAGLAETLEAMGLDHPGCVDLDIDVIQSRPTGS